MRLLFTFFVITMYLHTGLCQYTITGQDPQHIRWRQINTEKFRLVYDEQFEEEAQRVANIMNYTTTLVGNSLGQAHTKLNLVLHNHSVISNGFVTILPSRSEWFTVPPQDTYGQDWFEILAIHEGRHWAQLNRVKLSTTKFLSFFSGELGWGLGITQLHPWFLEGDAVVAETALSSSGRGRLPSFEMGFRTHMLTYHKPHNFREAVFGGYDKYVPNHYELGYLLVAYNRNKYGKELWQNVLDEVADNPILAPFNIAVKKYTGLNRSQLYENTMRELDSLWSIRLHDIKPTKNSAIPLPHANSYTSYQSPCYYEGKIIAIKSGFDNAKQIVIIDPHNAKETLLYTPGYLLSDRITHYGDYVFFDEYKPHVRWSYENYSIICALNIKTKQIKPITRKSRYFAPAPSPNGDKLVVVETNIKGHHSLNLIDPKIGTKLLTIKSHNNRAIQYPSWDESGEKIVCTFVDSAGKSIAIYNLKHNYWKILYTSNQHNISKPIFYKNYIFFEATFSGIDNIYAIDTLNKQIFQITQDIFGAFEPTIISDNKLLYTQYTAMGYKPVKTLIDTLQFTPLDKVKNVSLGLADQLVQHEPKKFDRSHIKNIQFESKPYRKSIHLIRIHSWLPFYLHQSFGMLNNPKIYPGYHIMSQNLLNTFTIEGGQGYYKRNIYHQLKATWMGWFPVFQAGIIQGDSIKKILITNQNKTKEKDLTFFTSVKFPLNFSKGSFTTTFETGLQYNYRNTLYLHKTEKIYQGENQLQTWLSFGSYKKSAPRALMPSIGYFTNINIFTPLLSKNTFSQQMIWQNYLYLPGLITHHSIKIVFETEIQKTNFYLAKSRLNNPRGYFLEWDSIQPSIKNMTKISIDYFFPITYSNFNLLYIFYVKRIGGGFFAENARTTQWYEQKKKYINYFYPSTGYLIFADMHIFFFPPTFRVGYYYGINFRQKKTFIEPIISLNFLF